MASAAVDFYQNSFAHLREELLWINHLLYEYIRTMRAVAPYHKFDKFSGFYISDEEIEHIIRHPAFLNEEVSPGLDSANIPQKTSLSGLRQKIDRKMEESLRREVYLPLAEIRQRFGLSGFEYHAMLLSLAPQVDNRYEKIYAYLQNDLSKKIPGVNLLLDLLCGPDKEERFSYLNYFHPAAALLRFGLVETLPGEAGPSATQQYVKVDPRVVYCALLNNAPDPRLKLFLEFLPPLDWDGVVIAEELKIRIQKLFQAALEHSASPNHAPILHFYGRPGSGKKTLLRALCSEAEIPLCVVNLRRLLHQRDSFRENIQLILREGILQPCAIAFDISEGPENQEAEQPLLLADLIREIHETGWLAFLIGEKPLSLPGLEAMQVCPVEVPPPDYQQQNVLWQMFLQREAENCAAEISHLTARFDLTGGQIASAVSQARQSARVRDPENPRVTLPDLVAASRVQSQPRLSHLARKITPNYRWNDLVLPREPLQQLRELANQVKYRHRVMNEWGFAGKLSLGKGINALFAGQSGTGKTMAAEVIANELGLDLYKIDLSAVVSKYIGETEKNLNRIFNEAEHSNAILFFDEADALLGKRSEVKDAHDRYANIEISYLLQKMEEYEGITILASNLRKNIDEAFTRRIRFIIEFPFPEEEYRRRIWKGIWPREIRLEPGVDLNFMARQFELAGGNIRNIALAAAFFAADNGQAVGMKHLVLAAKREFQKMGKLCEKADFGEYYELL